MLTAKQSAQEFSGEIPIFRQAWEMAKDDILKRFNEPGWDDSCRSHVIQMQAVIHARELFYKSPGVRYFTINKRHVFSVRDSGLFRLKQLDENHCTSNYGTDAAKAFDSDSALPGFDEYQKFTVGFVPKPDWTGFVGIYLTFPKAFKEKPNWVLDITGEPVDIESLQEEFNESISQQERRRFKPRKQSEKRSDDGET